MCQRINLLPLNVTFIDELLKKFQYFSLERPEKLILNPLYTKGGGIYLSQK